MSATNNQLDNPIIYLVYFQFDTTGDKNCSACEIWTGSTGNIISCYYFICKDKIPVRRGPHHKELHLKQTFRLGKKAGFVLFILYILFLAYAFTQEIVCVR